VNIPRSDEDRLKLMELIVFLLQKDVCDDIGITTARLSNYCCQANVGAVWLLLKRSGDVTRLQALVDKKKIVISEAVIREFLQLNDAEGVVDAAVAAAVVEDVIEDVAEDVAHVLDTCSALLRRVEHLEHDNVALRLEIVKLKARVKKLEQADKVKSLKLRRLRKVRASRQVESFDDMEDVFNQGRMINEDEGIELEDDSEVQDVVEVVTTAKLIAKVFTTAASQIFLLLEKGVIIRDPEEELPLKNPAETSKVKDKGKRILVEAPKPIKKKDQIKMDAEYARKLQQEIDRDHDGFNKDIDWDAAMDHVNEKSSSNSQYIKRYQGMKKRPQTESEARKNMMIYLKNTAGY
nr:hypothetical protein [Tanacetum cinerariifolium]